MCFHGAHCSARWSLRIIRGRFGCLIQNLFINKKTSTSITGPVLLGRSRFTATTLPLLVLSKITPSPSLTSFVHSRLPWASRHHTLLTRSVLAVSHDLDGLLRWLDCGLVASHLRSWGSHTFTLSRFPCAFCFPFRAFPARLALTCHLSGLVLTPPHSFTKARCPLAVSHLSHFQSVPKDRCRQKGSNLNSKGASTSRP